MATQRQEALATTDTQIREELSLTVQRSKKGLAVEDQSLMPSASRGLSNPQHKPQPLPTILRGKRCLLKESRLKGVRIQEQFKKVSWLKLIVVGEHWALKVHGEL